MRRTRLQTPSHALRQALHLLELRRKFHELFAFSCIQHGCKLRTECVNLRIGERPRAFPLRGTLVDGTNKLAFILTVELCRNRLRFAQKIVRAARAASAAFPARKFALEKRIASVYN